MTTIASATPGASRVPKADGAGKLLAGWLTAAVLLTDLGLGAGVAGDLVYGSGANTLARLPIGAAGRVMVSSGSAPAWSSKLAEGTITGLMTLGKSGSTARTMTFQDADTTVAGLNLAQTWTASQTVTGVSTRYTGNSAGAGSGSIYATTAYGLTIQGIVGSSYDFGFLKPDGSAFLWYVPTATSNVVFPGGSIVVGTTGLAAAERARFTGGTAPSAPGGTDVLIGAGQIKAGGAISAASLTASGLTSTWIPVAGTGGLLGGSADFTLSTTTLSIGGSTGAGALVLNATTGATRGLYYRTAGSNRVVQSVSGTEAGANAGSNYAIDMYSDAGAYIDTPLSIVRAAGGAIAIARPVTCTSTLSATSLTATGLTPGCVAVAGTGGLLGATSALVFDGTSLTAVRIAASGAVSAGTYAFDIVAGNSVDRSLARFGISGITNGLTIGFTQSTGAIAYSFLGGTGSAGSATFAVPITFPNGNAAQPGIRTTTYAHGLFNQASTALGFSAAGIEVGRADSTAGWSFFNSVDTAGSAASANRSIATAAASAIYNGFGVVFADTSAASASYFSSAYRGILNITGSGSNTGSGYDRGLTFEAYHRGSGTRAAVTGAFIEVGTYNGGSDSTGTITDLVGIKLQQLKTTSSVVTTGVLLDLGACVGTTKYAIRSASNSGIVSLGDTTDATTTGDGSGRFAGGLSVLKNIVNGGFISNLYQSTSTAAIQANTGAGVNIGAGVTDGVAAGFGSYPGYNGAFTVTRHNYFTLGNVTLNGSAACTDACVFRFDASAGTHKAVDSGTTKTSPGTVSAWVKININGTVHYMPAYTSKTT